MPEPQQGQVFTTVPHNGTVWMLVACNNCGTLRYIEPGEVEVLSRQKNREVAYCVACEHKGSFFRIGGEANASTHLR